MLGLLGFTLSRTRMSFGGEDLLAPGDDVENWHHRSLTKKAALQCRFSAEAADTVSWHADYVDSYLYNPLWWVRGGLGRVNASLSTKSELEKLHFDDLFSTDQIAKAWVGYLSGTLAGLAWAHDSGRDVAAAQNIVGASCHAVQDFYSHSTGSTWRTGDAPPTSPRTTGRATAARCGRAPTRPKSITASTRTGR